MINDMHRWLKFVKKNHNDFGRRHAFTVNTQHADGISPLDDQVHAYIYIYEQDWHQ